MPNYIGFHDDADLPFKKGDAVTILKGTPIKHRGEVITAGRTYRVKIDHYLNGHNVPTRPGFLENMKPASNPVVRWPGSGGYWSDVDVNLIPEFGARCSLCDSVDRVPVTIIDLQPICGVCAAALK